MQTPSQEISCLSLNHKRWLHYCIIGNCITKSLPLLIAVLSQWLFVALPLSPWAESYLNVGLAMWLVLVDDIQVKWQHASCDPKYVFPLVVWYIYHHWNKNMPTLGMRGRDGSRRRMRDVWSRAAPTNRPAVRAAGCRQQGPQWSPAEIRQISAESQTWAWINHWDFKPLRFGWFVTQQR